MVFVSIALFVVGVCLGSFVNALVWRLHEQERRTTNEERRTKKGSGKPALDLIEGRTTDDELSILRGRSMCPHCRHQLAAKDLIPIISWLWLRGKCRYCRKPISAQYPLVEAATGLLFVISYLAWPYTVYRIPYTADSIRYTVFFALWLALLVGFMALTVYDLKWMLLPNRIMHPLFFIAAAFALTALWALNPQLSALSSLLSALSPVLFAVLIGGGIFYLIFQLSGGKWIGGGDVKLGWLLGLVVMTPARSLLMIFLAALAGSLVSLPLLASQKINRKAVIPFGPFLILGAFVTVLWGANILNWYQSLIGY